MVVWPQGPLAATPASSCSSARRTGSQLLLPSSACCWSERASERAGWRAGGLPASGAPSNHAPTATRPAEHCARPQRPGKGELGT